MSILPKEEPDTREKIIQPAVMVEGTDIRFHCLKTWPEFFEAIRNGSKTFEVRRNDRDFKVGDILRLQEYHPESGFYTGREWVVFVTYVLSGGHFGIAADFCVLAIQSSSAVR